MEKGTGWMKKWKRWVSVGMIGLLTLGIIGCSQEQPAAEEEQPTVQAEPLKIGLLRIDDSLPFYVAEQEGLFAANGVAVELLSFSSGRDQSTALAAGELDGLMTDPVVTGLSIKGGADIRIVSMALGATAEEGRFLVVSAPDSGILTPEQLAGKTVAISNNTMMDYLMNRYEEILGLNAEQINKVNMPDLMLRTTVLLEGKDIDAAILPDPLASYAVAEGAHLVIDDTQLGENVSQSVVVMTKSSIDNRHEDIQRMLAAYEEAITLINQDQETWKAFAMENANVPASIAEQYQPPTFTLRAIPSEEEIAPVVKWLLDKQLIDHEYRYEELVDSSFYQLQN